LSASVAALALISAAPLVGIAAAGATVHGQATTLASEPADVIAARHALHLRGLRPLLTSSGDLTAPLTDDYPVALKAAARDAMTDPWRFYNRECVSFVAWRLNSRDHIDFTDFYRGRQWGDAASWRSAAISVGVPVDSRPRVGSVAWFASGHVAWVASVNSGGSVTLEEYNFVPGRYSTRTIAASSVSAFIHL